MVMKMLSLDNLKAKLNIQNNDDDLVLGLFLDDAVNLIMLYLEVKEFPDELGFIAEDIAVKKYRRMGNEGVQSEKIDVLTTTFASSKYLEEYIPYLDLYKKNTLKKDKKLRLL